jgi:hypothetical protein
MASSWGGRRRTWASNWYQREGPLPCAVFVSTGGVGKVGVVVVGFTCLLERALVGALAAQGVDVLADVIFGVDVCGCGADACDCACDGCCGCGIS